MRIRFRGRWIAAGAVAAVGVSALLGWPSGSEATAPLTMDDFAEEALSSDPERAARAIASLRASGPAGLDALTRVHREELDRLRTHPPTGHDEAIDRLRHAIDVVSGQRDGHASGLYWHTDLEAAQREAVRTGRPILSLRLLGRLDEELSCANSRFFRVVLYSDPRVAAHLRERFVLHWSTERPAPRIEIDMGDGRRIVRTITGNSVHYVLDAQGQVVDALVGLYAPSHFVSVLEGAERIHRACLEGGQRCLSIQHARALGGQREAWGALRTRDPSVPEWTNAVASLPGGSGVGRPSATAAMALTEGKMRVETPALDLMRRGGANRRGARNQPEPGDVEPDWVRVAALSTGAVGPLSTRTRNLLRLKTGQDDVDAMARDLAETALADGARNEVLFHRRIRAWFAEGEVVGDDFGETNRRVYSELLLTPASDPWLGLRADDLYDGVEVER